MRWPPRSQRLQAFPEVDRVAWFEFVEAASKIVQGQVAPPEPARGRPRG